MPIVIKLDDIMRERGIKLMDLAAEIGLTDVNLSRIKTNKVKAIRFSTLGALCEALGCQPGDLIVYEPDGDPQ